ncbi:MAG TPA: hypothetical protein VFD41_04105 [Actinomycetales bacterium]|nr:hypothetical protein [Actinomycetales bacterium]
MPQLIETPTRIPVPGGKLIDEYAGRVSSGTEGVSVARMQAPACVSTAWPAFSPDAAHREE